jgi:hypothetical protein
LRKGGGELVRRPRSELDLLDVQDVAPVGLVADHASEHRFRLDSKREELDDLLDLL